MNSSSGRRGLRPPSLGGRDGQTIPQLAASRWVSVVMPRLTAVALRAMAGQEAPGPRGRSAREPDVAARRRQPECHEFRRRLYCGPHTPWTLTTALTLRRCIVASGSLPDCAAAPG